MRTIAHTKPQASRSQAPTALWQYVWRALRRSRDWTLASRSCSPHPPRPPRCCPSRSTGQRGPEPCINARTELARVGRVGQQHYTMACAMMGTIIGHCEALGGRLHLIMSCSISALRACRRRLCMHMRCRKRHPHTGVAAAAAGAMARALYDLVGGREPRMRECSEGFLRSLGVPSPSAPSRPDRRWSLCAYGLLAIF